MSCELSTSVHQRKCEGEISQELPSDKHAITQDSLKRDQIKGSFSLEPPLLNQYDLGLVGRLSRKLILFFCSSVPTSFLYEGVILGVLSKLFSKRWMPPRI